MMVDGQSTNKDDVQQFLINLLKTEKQIEVSNMNDLLTSLDIDSFGFLEIIFSIEHEYNVSFPKNYEHLKTLQDVVDTTYQLIEDKA